MVTASAICFWFEVQVVCRAFSRAFENTGNKIAAKIAIIAITTKSSIRVNPPPHRCFSHFVFLLKFFTIIFDCILFIIPKKNEIVKGFFKKSEKKRAGRKNDLL